MAIRDKNGELIKSAKRAPVLFTVYVTLRVIVIAVMVAQVFNRNWNDVFFCAVTLVLFLIPSFIEKRIKVNVPDTLEIIVLLFIFAAEILGEIRGYYIHVPGWDTALHTANGFLAAAIGLALIDILNRSDRFAISLSPLFVVMVSFCFSMTVGVIWEFFEYAMDMFFGMDMQKDTIIHGMVDIGLHDTMKDLLVNFIGAAVFSLLGYIHIKNRGKGKSSRFLRRFMLTKIVEKSDALTDAHGAYTSSDEALAKDDAENNETVLK